MKGKMFAIYDSKAGIHHAPFTTNSSAQAIRMTTSTALDERTELNKYPADFTLFEIATFDDSSGQISPLAAKINLGTVQEFLVTFRNQQQELQA